MLKTCPVCSTNEVEFVQGHNKCKPCHAKYQREWRLNNPGKYSSYSKKWREANPGKQTKSSSNWQTRNPEYSSDYNLKKRYGISLDDYKRMVIDQDGKCAICKQESKLFVDHCHTTGKVRQLLCHKHNTGLGHFQENIDYLKSAIAYLELHQTI